MEAGYAKHDYCMEREGLDKVCKFALDSNVADSPHFHEPARERQKIYANITEVIGNTPLVRLNNIPKKDGIKCEILVKCEYLNPGGSVKDRIGRRMVLDAERSNRIKRGDILIENNRISKVARSIPAAGAKVIWGTADQNPRSGHIWPGMLARGEGRVADDLPPAPAKIDGVDEVTFGV